MEFSTVICKAVSKLLPVPQHPFNMQNEGKDTYAEWQYKRGQDTIRFYLDKTSKEEMFKDKIVLDIGCGAAGKTLYYASQGVRKIYGMDVVEWYEDEANALARQKGMEHLFQFVLGDAARMEFEDNFFDTIIMNDAMEHVDKPLAVLKECYRVLKPGSRLYINFPPYYHPYGAHLSDAIGFPWIHVFFSDQTLIKVYKDLVKDLPDGNKRISFRISTDETGREYFSYINKMTIKKFCSLLEQVEFDIYYYNEVPLRSFLKPLCRIPFLKEGFVKMVVCILEKPRN